MMAGRFSALFIICFAVPLCISAVPPGRHRRSIKGISRNRREVCVDGSYEFGGRRCCYCAVGLQVEEQCSNNMTYGKCMICQNGTYSSDPSSGKTCQRCTSCTHPNANLEEEEPCTAARDTKCRCKKDHFCSSKECIVCHPCKVCGVGGVKEDCTATSDRVCNEDTGAVAGIVFVVILLAACIIAAVIYWARAHQVFHCTRKNTDGKSGPCEDTTLLDVDIEPLLYDITEEIGWKDMRKLALRTGIKETFIESCELDYPKSTEERTLQLLKRWVEKEGRNAPNKLVQTLKEMNKNGKAEKITVILSKANSASSNNSNNQNVYK